MPFNNYSYPYGYQQQQPLSLTQVVGLAGAKAYQTPLNSTVALFDSNEAVFYVKTTDAFGNSNVRTFDFQERLDEDKPDYVTKQEFNVLNNKIDSLLEVLNGKSTISSAPSTITDSNASDGADAQSAQATRRRKPASTV